MIKRYFLFQEKIRAPPSDRTTQRYKFAINTIFFPSYPTYLDFLLFDFDVFTCRCSFFQSVETINIQMEHRFCRAIQFTRAWTCCAYIRVFVVFNFRRLHSSNAHVCSMRNFVNRYLHTYMAACFPPFVYLFTFSVQICLLTIAHVDICSLLANG